MFVKGFLSPFLEALRKAERTWLSGSVPIPLTSSATASKRPDEPGCTLQGQSPELFSLNETTLSFAWKECLEAFFLLNEEVLQNSYNTAKYPWWPSERKHWEQK